MSLLEQLDKNIAASGGLIVSCQPVPGSPLDKPEIVAAMALAAEQTEQVAEPNAGTKQPRQDTTPLHGPPIGNFKQRRR